MHPEDQSSETTSNLPSPPSGGLVLPDQLLPPNLFIVPTLGPVLYPTLMAPVNVAIPRYVETVEEVIQRQRVLGLIVTRGSELNAGSTPEALHEVGVAVKVLKRIRMPDGSVNLLVHAVKRFRAVRVLSPTPHLVVEAQYLDDVVEKDNELDALTRSVISHVKKLSEVNPFFTEEMRLAMINAPGPGTVADLVAFALTLKKEDAQDFLETSDVKRRFEKLLVHLRREQDVADLQKKIQTDVNSKINTMQREFFLREQMKAIKKELGLEEDGKEKSLRTFRERIEASGMPEDVKKVALEELDKFETLNENSPEFNVSRSYLEMLCALPWSKRTEDQLDLGLAERVLDEDHYGLEKVKQRILEFLAVRTLNPDPKRARGSILCLVGPPGVGKTSIGKSVARTLGRNFYRFSLGGMRDEAEIKGHRRTYVGAMPGKILQALKRAGTKNPVIMLDEIDKLGSSYQGDPSSALLEVLDPEQNSSFLDHYLDVPFDLSECVFIATANTLTTIPEPLLDRMEVIEIPGYTIEEKETIAERYVIPKVLSETGIKPGRLRIQKAALRQMLSDYAREPGVRVLEQLLNKIARRAAVSVVRDKSAHPFIVREADLQGLLGPKRYFNELANRVLEPGVITGLAWTAFGGDILFIEATDLPGSGALKLTGKMGETMQESANIAWTYVKKRISEEKNLKQTDFSARDLHLHIPAGAIPKDGPSAGVTMATALYSLLTGRKSRQRIAMTGELSLKGLVLPVGGIKEKILAAKRVGVTEIILPKANQKDLPEIPKYALEGMRLHWVTRLEDVFKIALEPVHMPIVDKPQRKKTRAIVLRKKHKKARSSHRLT
jgi:ATP-dependent Lon protease